MVKDNSQKTGLRINLQDAFKTCIPTQNPSVCSNVDLLDQLDGFSVNPRVMVCFSGPISLDTISSGVYIVRAGGARPPIKINQVISDVSATCIFGKPDHVLDQGSRYLLVVTDSVKDRAGNRVIADAPFATALASNAADDIELNEAVAGVSPNLGKIVAATIFTTMSATDWLEKARAYVDRSELPIVLPAGLPFVFSINSLSTISWLPAQSGLPAQDLPVSALSGVGEIAFGLYLSPNYLAVSGAAAGTIANTPTGGPIGNPVPVPGVPPGIPSGYIPISFHVFLPAGLPPVGGFPAVIYGHGMGDSQFGAPTYIASTLAQKGIATIAMEIQGHGYGQASTVQLTTKDGAVHTVATPGRGILLPGKASIVKVNAPRAIVAGISRLGIPLR